jgi:hypothetical protein
VDAVSSCLIFVRDNSRKYMAYTFCYVELSAAALPGVVMTEAASATGGTRIFD